MRTLRRGELIKRDLLRYLFTDYEFPVDEVEIVLQNIYNRYGFRRKARYTDLGWWVRGYKKKEIDGLFGKIDIITLI